MIKWKPKDNGHFASLYKDKLKKVFRLRYKKYLKIQKMFYQNH